MIFVTVGSIQFDDLVRRIDDQVRTGRIREKVVIQIGNGSYEPASCEFFRTAPGLDSYYANAALVIGHGGTGTTLEVLEKGLRLISVSNPGMIDNHQDEFLEALASRGFVTYCKDHERLPELIETLLARPPPPAVNVSEFFGGVIADLAAAK
jgi:beta-1,4-N-acetylglucosaminyltransferase